MSFKGSLESFNFTNILQMISLEKKTGLLKVEQGDASISAAFRDGLVVYAERKGAKDFDRLKYTLVGNKIIPKERMVRAIKENQATMEPMWSVLAKYAPKEALRQMLERQIKDVLFTALQWERGLYQFDITDELNVSTEVDVSLGVDFILMEGCRVADEWRVLAKRFPAPDSTLKRSKEVKKAETDNEKKVLSYFKDEVSVETLVNVSRLGEFDTCEAIDSLIKKGTLKVIAGKKKEEKEKVSIGLLVKQSMGYLAPGLILLLALAGVAIQAKRLGSFLPGQAPGMEYVFKELSESRLDFIFSRLQLYTSVYGEYPRGLEQLIQTGLLAEGEQFDNWGNPVQFFIRNNRFFLYIAGREGDVTRPEVIFGQ